jgi:hypothetical protein
MKFAYAWTSVEAPAPPPEKQTHCGLPAEFELGRLIPTGLFLLVGGYRIRCGYLEWRVSTHRDLGTAHEAPGFDR